MSFTLERMSASDWDDYDPRRDRALFGSWTDELTRKIPAKNQNASVMAIDEVVNAAAADDDTVFSKLLQRDRGKAMDAIEATIEWASDEGSPISAPAPALAATILRGLPASLTARIPSEVSSLEPEMSGRQPLTGEELAMFEVPPEGLTPEQFEEERYRRKERKGQTPLRYRPLTEKDLGPDGDLGKVYRAVDYFLGRRRLEVGGKPVTKTFPARSARMTDDQKRDVIGRLLGTVRDNKIKAWREARDKAQSGEPLSSAEARRAKFFGPSPMRDSGEAQLLGRKRAHFDNMVLNLLRKSPVEERGERIIRHEEKGSAKPHTDIPTSGATRGNALHTAMTRLVDYLRKGARKPAEYEKEEDGGKTKAVHEHGLARSLRNLGRYIEEGGVRFDTRQYDALVKRFKAELDALNLGPDELAAIYMLFPEHVTTAAEGDEDGDGGARTRMLSPQEAFSRAQEQHKEAKGQLEVARNKISRSQEDVDAVRPVVKRIGSLERSARKAYNEALSISPDLAPKAKTMFESAQQQVKVGPGERITDIPGKFREAVKSAKEKFIKANKPGHGEDAEEVADLIEKSVNEETESKSLMKRAGKQYGKVIPLVMAETSASDRERAFHGTMKGVQSLFSRPKEELEGVYESGNDLLKSVEEAVSGQRGKTSFEELPELIEKLNDVVKALRALKGASKAKEMWDYGGTKMYMGKPREAEPGEDEDKSYYESLIELRGAGKSDEGGDDSVKSPQKIINDILDHDLVSFLLKKSEQLRLGSKGRPEAVRGPSFEDLDDVIDVFKKAVSLLKNYDPKKIERDLLRTALSKLSVGSQIARIEQRQQRAQKSRQERSRAKMEAEKTKKETPETEAKPQEKLSSMLWSFMTKAAAVREALLGREKEAVPKSNINWGYFTKREKKTGPVYFEPFFINPDDVDEFVHALGREGFSFMDSVVESGERGPIPEGRSGVKGEAGKGPRRGYDVKINDIVAKTMLKGAASLEDYVLNNKDRMAALLGGRLDDDRRRAKEIKSEISRIDEELKSPELKGEGEFLSRLAEIINDPKAASEEAAQQAFPAKVRSERAKTLRSIQRDLGKTLEKVDRYNEFKKRRDRLARKYEAQGIDPESRDDYRYADEVVRDVDYLRDQIGSFENLRWLHKNIPEYDRLQSRLQGLQAKRDRVRSAEPERGERGQPTSPPDLPDEELRLLEDLRGSVDYLRDYLQKKKKFKSMEREHPFESRRERDVETEETFERVRGLPREEKKEIRRTQEERERELSELEDFEDWSSWIRKIEKPLFPETAKGVSVDLARERMIAKSLRKAVADAEEKVKSAPEGDARDEAEKTLKSKKENLSRAESRVSSLEKKLAAMRTRKTERGDIKPGEHEPKAVTRAWKDFHENIEAAILGKKRQVPKFLADFVNSADLARTDNDELVAMLRGIERRLRSEQAEDRVIPARSLSSDDEWDSTKKRVVDALEQRKKEARGILDDAKQGRIALKSSDLTDEEKEEVEAAISEMQGRIRNLRANAQTATEIIKRLEQMRGRQKALREESAQDLRRRCDEFLDREIPEPEISKGEVVRALDEMIDQPKLMGKKSFGSFEFDSKIVDGILRRAVDLSSKNEDLAKYALEGEALAKAINEHPSKEQDPALQDSASKLRGRLEEARKSRDVSPLSYAESRLSEKLREALSASVQEGLPPDEAEKAAKAVSDKVDAFRKNFTARASQLTRRENLPTDWIEKELKKERPPQERSRTIKYLDLNPPVKNTFAPMVAALMSDAKSMQSSGTAKGAKLMAYLQSAREVTGRYVSQLEYMSELVDNALRFTRPGGKVSEEDAKRARERLESDYATVKEGQKALFGAAGTPSVERSAISDAVVSALKNVPDHSVADQTSVRSWLESHRKDLKKIAELTRTISEKMEGGSKAPVPAPAGRATANVPDESDPFWSKRAADDDFDPTDIENWLSSAPRQYLEDLPRIPMDDWDIIEALYGKRMAEYKDLVRGNQMVLDSEADKSKLKKLMTEARQRAARLEALKDATATVGAEKVRLADAGNVFNKRLSQYLAKKNRLLMKRRALMEGLQRFQHSIDTAEDFVDTGNGKGAEMKKPLTKREMQSITDQFYRGLFWYLQDYWRTPVGKETVFGGRESPEFSQVYDTMKALSGVRSSPVIQRVIIAGNKARGELREIQDNIRKRRAGLKRLGIDPDDMLDKFEKKYGKRGASKDESEKELESAKEPGYRLGFSLYVLTRHRDQLLAQIRQKKAMNKLLGEAVSAEYKKNVLESIAANSADPALKRQIEDRVRGMEGDLKEEMERKAKAAEEEAKEVSIEAERMREGIPDEVMEAPTVGTEEPAIQEAKPKESSYRADPNFDLALLYSDAVQSVISSLAERAMNRG